MWLDAHSAKARQVRGHVTIVTQPIAWLAAQPSILHHWLSRQIGHHQTLEKENQQLRTQAFLLRSKLQQLLLVEQENRQLRELLASTKELSSKAEVAKVLAIQLDPALHQLVIDQGTEAGVYEGQPVVDAFGVMGQVIAAGPSVSTVLLLTDSQSAIPVQDSKNGLRAIAVGDGGDGLRLINVTKTSDISVGDLFVCSGLGQRFPMGYPVGKVVSVKQKPGNTFLQVSLKPVAHLDRSRNVLVVWPQVYKMQQAIQQQLAAGEKTVQGKEK